MDTNLVLPLGPRKCQVIFDYFLDASLKVLSFIPICTLNMYPNNNNLLVNPTWMLSPFRIKGKTKQGERTQKKRKLMRLSKKNWWQVGNHFVHVLPKVRYARNLLFQMLVTGVLAKMHHSVLSLFRVALPSILASGWQSFHREKSRREWESAGMIKVHVRRSL